MQIPPVIHSHFEGQRERERDTVSPHHQREDGGVEFICGIYFDSNLQPQSKEGIHIKEVIDFCHRFLPEVLLREDSSNFAQQQRAPNGTINDLQYVDRRRRRRTVPSMASKRDFVKR